MHMPGFVVWEGGWAETSLPSVAGKLQGAVTQHKCRQVRQDVA